MELERGETCVLAKLIRHNTWANLTLLDFCTGLSDAQLDAGGAGGFGSIRATLVHIIGAEVNYVNLATDKAPAVPMPEDAFPGFPVMREAARWAGDELLQVAATARADTIIQTIRPDEPVYEYPLAGLIVQALDHGAWHRAQIASTVRHLGLVPPSVSGWKYMRELGEFKEFHDGVPER